MAHYTLLDENNIVVNVIVATDENDLDDLPEEYTSWEECIEDRYSMTCKRTSYNTIANTHLLDGTPFRGNYASVGDVYDTENDVFYQQKPYESWSLNTTNWTWEAPLEKPTDGRYYWDEELYQSDNTQGWVLNEY